MNKDGDGLAGRIRQVMADARFNQQELAALLGISQPAISLYLQGRIPPAAVLLALAQLGKTSIEWLLTGRESGESVLTVSEERPAYGKEGKVLAIWRDLKPGVQEDLLRLMQHLCDKQR